MKKMSPTTPPVLASPLFCAFLFLGSVVAASSLSATFWLSPPTRRVVLLAPLPFLLLLVLSQVRFFRQAESEARSLLFESAFFATAIALSALVLGELFARLGARLWDPTETWHWVVLLACLLGTRRARIRRP